MHSAIFETLFQQRDNAMLVIAASSVLCVLYAIYKFLSDPLRDIPGPLLARFTRLWEIYHVGKGKIEHINFALHEKHGPIVRLAPNRYSISDPSMIRTIYGAGSKFTKSDFYLPFNGPMLEHQGVFQEPNIAKHADTRKRISNMYAMSSLISYEPFVDNVNANLIGRLESLAEQGKPFNLFTWMQFYAFDVIGEITISRSFGLLDAGRDKDGLLEDNDYSINGYSSRIGLVPEFHRTVLWFLKTFVRGSFLETMPRVVQREVGARVQSEAPDGREDFMTKCINAQKAGKMEDWDVSGAIINNFAAGSDTTGISPSAVIYFLMRNPRCMRKLRDELAEAEQKGEISPTITFHEGQKLAYLQAVIKEALRLHPAVGMILPRVVPAGGAELAGKYFPAGTVVGINAYVTHRDKSIWGPDAEEFRPERWLVPKEEASILEHNFFAFGAGARTCIGKNISYLEMSKMLPQVLRTFDFTPTSEREWETLGGFLVKPRVEVIVSKRSS